MKTNTREFRSAALFAILLPAVITGVFFVAEYRRSGPGVDQPGSSKLRLEEGFEERESHEAGLRFRRLQLVDENGVIPLDGLTKAKAHIIEMRKASAKRRSDRNDEIQEAGVIPDSWTWLGPGNIGGRVRSLLIHPSNPNLMWTGGVSGGIWRTTNGGSSWAPVDDFMGTLAISTMVMDPTNPSIMYAGTGEGFGNGDAIFGAGVYRSTDGGASWNQLQSTADWRSVNRLAVSPDGTTILAARNTGLYRSTNGGNTWSEVSQLNGITDVDFHPTNSSRALFARSGGVSYSQDGGQTWTNSTLGQGLIFRIEVAYSKSEPNIVYASADNDSNGDVLRSTDGGRNFTRVFSGLGHLGKQGWYGNIVWVNPMDPDFVIVGGIHLWRSTDGGTTFTQISDGSASAHADHHVIVEHPSFNNGTNKRAFFGNDGGVYRADDVSAAAVNAGWTELNNNLGITQFYAGSGATNSGLIIGGTQDNGTLIYRGNTETWTSMEGKDGGYCAADPTDANYFYGESQNLGVIRSSDGGLSSVGISSGITDRPQPNTECQCNFIAPLVLDPNNPQRLLAGGWSLWRTNDSRAASPTWTSIKSPLIDNPISAIAVAPGAPDFVVVGHNNGNMFRTENGTADAPEWTGISHGRGLPSRFITQIVIDTTRTPDWIYATYGGFSEDNVFVSRDLGATWTEITGTGSLGLPDVPVRALAIHPHNRNLLYVGTEVGIFTSQDAGATWDLPNGGPADVSVDDLFWIGGDLIAATHGRGMYRASGGLYVDCNYNGVQLGTFSQPFKTVNGAINALTSYRPIWLKPCSYNEQVNTGKRLELRTLTGPATVGAP